jgi:4-amino-4-deoxy-L-arabinose transferase-like glycosyltransferase
VVGVVGMCATLTKGVILPYPGVFGIVSGLLALKRRSIQRVAAVVAMFIAMAVVLAPWTYRNYQVTGGRFVLLPRVRKRLIPARVRIHAVGIRNSA